MVVASAAPASAHTFWVVTGYAYDGTSIYDISIAHTFDPYDDCPELVPGPEGEIGCVKFDVWIRQFNFGDDVVFTKFLGEDNWVPPEVNAGHVGEFHATSIDPSVDFALDGYQVSANVTAWGHYEQFQIYASFLPTFV